MDLEIPSSFCIFGMRTQMARGIRGSLRPTATQLGHPLLNVQVPDDSIEGQPLVSRDDFVFGSLMYPYSPEESLMHSRGLSNTCSMNSSGF